MSLESEIAGLREDLKANTKALEAILKTGGGSANKSPAGAKAKPSAESEPAANGDASAPGLDQVRQALHRFIDAKNPDVDKRKTAITGAFKKLKVKDIKEIKPEMRQRFMDFLDQKDAKLKEEYEEEQKSKDDFLEDEGGDDWDS